MATRCIPRTALRSGRRVQYTQPWRHPIVLCTFTSGVASRSHTGARKIALYVWITAMINVSHSYVSLYLGRLNRIHTYVPCVSNRIAMRIVPSVYARPRPPFLYVCTCAADVCFVALYGNHIYLQIINMAVFLASIAAYNANNGHGFVPSTNELSGLCLALAVSLFLRRGDIRMEAAKFKVNFRLPYHGNYGKVGAGRTCVFPTGLPCVIYLDIRTR